MSTSASHVEAHRGPLSGAQMLAQHPRFGYGAHSRCSVQATRLTVVHRIARQVPISSLQVSASR
jgi:hypothetical protein